jgi:thiol-disulfide isomerase/thioredoxin
MMPVRFIFRVAVIGALAPIAVTPFRSAAAQVQMWDVGLTVGVEAPSAVVERLEGGTVNLADFYGRQPVVLEFWATWCPLCRKLEPSLQAAREKYAGKVTFVSVGVPANQTPEKQKAYVDEKKLTGVFTFDRSGAAMKAFAVPHTSYIVVVGLDRRIAYTGVGDDQDIDAVLAKLGTR